MDDILAAFDSWLPAHMRLFFVGLTVLGIAALLEKLARLRWGIVVGIPIGRLVEDYEGKLGNPREVDLGAHLHEVGSVEWVSDKDLLLLPLNGEVHMHASAGGRMAAASSGFVCVGDLRVDAPGGSIRFSTRVLLRIVPVLGALLFIFGPYVPDPWGMGWPLPGRGSLLLSVWPAILFGGFFGFVAVRARTGVITAHHAVTAAFMAELQPAEPSD